MVCQFNEKCCLLLFIVDVGTPSNLSEQLWTKTVGLFNYRKRTVHNENEDILADEWLAR